MLYKELQRVNDIDSAIADLHKNLADLYKERASLLGASPSLPAANHDDLINTYYRLQSIWEDLGIRFPALKTVEKKLQKAVTLKQQLQLAAPQDNPQIVAVPTSHNLQKILADQADKAVRFIIDPELLNQSRRVTSWRFVVVMAPKAGARINGVRQFIDSAGYTYRGHDGRGMGVYELIAAELQGVPAVSAGRWSVLLKDSFDGDARACAYRDNQSVIFDLEDTDCLIGENYLPITIAA